MSVVSKANGAITFTATSNNVKATEVARGRGWGRAQTELGEAISRNNAFERAFRSDEDEGEPFSRHASQKNSERAKPAIIQSSGANETVYEACFGLVSALIDAYNTHHNLVLRPDDVWQAILTQFSFYVNANAEELRDEFVDFEGKKTLVVYMDGNLFSADFASFANRMVDEQIATNLKDPEVTEWLIPKFSTTKSADRVAASVTIMSTLQAYFEYVCGLCCGIPQVTLEGNPDDWRLLRQKIDRLLQYDIKGKEQVMRKWHGLLSPVLEQFIQSSEGKPQLDFWDKICSHHGGGSGPSYISGWATVFACFTAKGKWQGDVPDKKHVGFGNFAKPEWPIVDTSDIPVGAVSVPVLVDDNGVQYDTQMLAGQFAYEAVGKKLDTIQSRNDWCIAYEGTPKTEPRAYKQGAHARRSSVPAPTPNAAGTSPEGREGGGSCAASPAGGSGGSSTIGVAGAGGRSIGGSGAIAAAAAAARRHRGTHLIIDPDDGSDNDGGTADPEGGGALALKDDPEYQKYFRMLEVGLPMGAVKNAMQRDEKDPEIMDGDPNEPAPAKVALPQRDDPEYPALKDDPDYQKYFRMLEVGLPMGAVKNAMQRDGKDPEIMDIDPNEPAPAKVAPPRRDDPEYQKYFKMLKMGLPVGAVKNALQRDGKDPGVMDRVQITR